MTAQPAPITGAGTWALEVVRGAEPGRRYVLPAGPCTLGNALAGEPGVDLAKQEGASPKRMAGRQARLECGNGGLVVRDLDTPGGTFVNRERLRTGSSRVVGPGDVIQVGGVQLKVVRDGTEASAAPARGEAAAPAQARVSERGTFAYRLPGGTVCRTWDDVLRASAQRWGELREELTTGRLAAFLHGIGRSELVPDPLAGGSPDERLDAWLARLPGAAERRPELDVHPRKLRVPWPAAGGTTRVTVQVNNAGFGLLRFTPTVEPAGTEWLDVGPGETGRERVVVETAELSLLVRFPQRQGRETRQASVRLTSNGGEIGVEVMLEAPAEAELPAGEAAPEGRGGRRLVQGIRGHPRWITILASSALLGGLRATLDAGQGWSGSPDRLGLAGPAAIWAVLLCAVGWLGSKRATALGDRVYSTLAGGLTGVFVATFAVAMARAIEPPLGIGPGTWWALWFWGMVGAGAGLAITWWVGRERVEGES